ncbi:MAG: shikimate kinase [Myxococcota bacterium]
MLLQTIGQRLRAKRQDLGITQATLAERAGVSVRFLVQLEKGRGNISINRLTDVCSALNVALEDLFRGLGPGGPKKVTLVGLRGAGKSTVGHALSSVLGMPFVEIDDRIAQAGGLSLSEIFEVGGSGLYRELEARVIDQILAEDGACVLAAGGSVVTSPGTWRALRRRTRTVWLKASPQSHLQRVINQGDLRPMRGRPDALRELTEILARRSPLYAMADLTLDTERLGMDGVLARLTEYIQS